jgi:hypothetical protein
MLCILVLLAGCFPKQEAPTEIEQPDQSAPPEGFPAHKRHAAAEPVPSQPQPPAQPLAPAPAAPTLITVQQKTTAYDVAEPAKPVGVFLPGTLLELGAPASAPGMMHVTYRSGDGSTIAALVKTDDLNKVPGPAPSTATAPPPTAPAASVPPLDPKGLSGSRPPSSNPNYKGLGK